MNWDFFKRPNVPRWSRPALARVVGAGEPRIGAGWLAVDVAPHPRAGELGAVGLR